MERVFAVATSVVRRAVNRDTFLAGASERAGIDIEVITGDEEARLSLLGVLSVVGTGGRKLVMDIGGGSTEFIVSEDGSVAGEWSMEMGVVHLTEKHLVSDPPASDELAGLEAEIKGVIDDLKRRMTDDGVDPSGINPSHGGALVGTAGTITTLAAVDQDLKVYDRDRINNYLLQKGKIEDIYKRLSGLTLEERGEILSLEKGREDLIIPGSAIALEAMDSFGFAELVVSDAGLLEGVILDRGAGWPGAERD